MSSILAGLNADQQKVVLATHGPVLVLAGAGSGKTRALTHRIAYLVEQGLARPEEILAVTFTNKAALEMKHRVTNLLGLSGKGVKDASTFHSMGVKILREQVRFHTRSKGFSIFDMKDSEKLVRKALRDNNYSLREWSPSAIRGAISRIKHDTMEDPVFSNPENPQEEVLSRIFPLYERMLADHDAYDFDDLLRIPLRILRAHEIVRLAYQARWRFVSVDEYQDTNPMQDEIIGHLLGPERNICVVGDDYQSIYSWRGANVDHILQFEARHPGCTTILLTQNYRSTPNILNAANAVIAQNVNQKHKKLWTDQKEGSDVAVVRLPSDREEVAWVCQQIQEHVSHGGSLSDCAVLYRTNAQSRLLEEQFLMRRIPYTIVGGFRFYDRKEIKDALALLSFFTTPSSRIHFERIADALLTRVGPKTIDRWVIDAKEAGISLGQHIALTGSSRADIRAIFSAFREAKRTEQEHENVSDLLRILITKTGYLSHLEQLPDGKERIENVNELFNVAAAYTTVESFLEDSALLSDIDTGSGSDSRVTCMTLHASKGLEFPLVFIIGCEEMLLPHQNSFSSSADIEEERRLFYVGMTRARTNLTITHSAYRFRGGEMVPQMPSRFLDHLPGYTPSPIENNMNVHQNIHDDITDFLIGEDEPTLVRPTSGSYVSHPKFGKGVIIGISNDSLTCVFEGHGVKSVETTSCSAIS